MDEKQLKDLLFAHIVEDFDDVKKLYQDGEAPKAYKLFNEKLKEIKSYTREPAKPIKGAKPIGV